MGEITEMMMDGMLCIQCGVFLGEDETFEPYGYPKHCPACEKENQ